MAGNNHPNRSKKAVKISATFSDGQTIERNTTLNLTHAWQFKGVRDGQPSGYSGFASSEELARRAMRIESRFLAKAGKITSEEIVPVTRA